MKNSQNSMDILTLHVVLEGHVGVRAPSKRKMGVGAHGRGVGRLEGGAGGALEHPRGAFVVRADGKVFWRLREASGRLWKVSRRDREVSVWRISIVPVGGVCEVVVPAEVAGGTTGGAGAVQKVL